MAVIRGGSITPQSITIADDDTDNAVLTVPNNRILTLTQIEINNRTGVDVRVRAWDTFTDTDAVAHTSAAAALPIFDYPVAVGDAVVMEVEKDVLSVMVAQCDHGATGNGVELTVGGEWKV